MDLPPSGWYPDPYGVPDLLRWWDGSTWTHHTHPGVGGTDSGGGAAGGGGGAAAGSGTAGGAHRASVQETTVQPAGGQVGTGAHAAGQHVAGQSATGQPGTGRPAGGGWATRDRVIGDWAGGDWPTGDQLANTLPPKGPRTEPQPALPATSVQSAAQATTYQSAVQATTYQPTVQPTVYQPAVAATSVQSAQQVQPTTVQPAQPTTMQPSNGWGMAGQQGGGLGATAYLGANSGSGAAGPQATGGADGSGTQVLFLGGDTWQVPGGPGGPGAPAGLGGPGGPNRYGYQQAQRRRRMWLIGGLVAGTAVAIAIIVVVATSLGSSPTPSTADQAAATPTVAPPSPTAAATTATPTASASVSATTPTSVLSDGQSGLSYAQLAAPWQPVCPSDLDSAFSWTSGESAVAGQINGGQTAWYGEACSGPLPTQYNYSGVGDLENTATNVAQTLENAYYNPLSHTAAPVLSEPITVSGHPGWEIEYMMTYTNAAAQGATWTTEEGAVVVADTGTGNAPAVFFTSIPENLNEGDVGTLVSSLQLTVVPTASTVSPTATASVTPPATVTPPAPGTTPTTTPPATATGANP
jgi:hypothetical protein